MKTADVVDILMKFDNGDISSREAVENLDGAEPYDLYMAECDLFFLKRKNKSDIGEISKLYLQLIKGSVEERVLKLKEDHPVRVLIEEHERLKSLLLILDDLFKENQSGFTGSERDTFLNIMDKVDEFKKHIDREEEVLFERLSDKGPAGRTTLMKQEHRDFIKKIEEIRRLWNDKEGDFSRIKEEVKELIYDLRMHTFLENDMFYPVVLDVLDDWEKIKDECDEIGYPEFSAV